MRFSRCKSDSLLPVYVSALPRTRGMGLAAELAAEWADPPFSVDRMADVMEEWGGLDESRAELFVAWRDGRAAGMLCAKMGRLWPDGGRVALAPLVWAKRQDSAGARVSTANHDAATEALASAFLDWGRDRSAECARVVFRPGLSPGADALGKLGLHRMFDVCVRNAILPEDEVGRGASGRVSAEDIEHWRAEAEIRGDADWVEKKIRERFGWAPLRGRGAPEPARALSPADAGRALELLRDARGRRGESVDERAFGEWLSQVARSRGMFALGARSGLSADADGKLSGLMGGWTTRHPLAADCGLSMAAFVETAGGKPSRRAQDSLALGMLLRERRVRTFCFILPLGDGWSDFRERWHLRLAGNGFGRTLAPLENEKAL